MAGGRTGVQPYFAPGKFSELKSNAGLHLEEVVSALMEAAAMETAATIMETSADREQTVADTEALEPDVVDPPRTEENVAGMLLHCAYF